MTTEKETPLCQRIKIPLREYEAMKEHIIKVCAIVESTYYNWVEGRTIPSIAKKQQLASILKCTVEEIFPEGKEAANV
jgi:DNA-binding XRE family transcriptional regulator